MTAGETARVFFAVWPDVATRVRIAQAATALRLDTTAKFVPQESYHLTLAFIGEVSAAQLALVLQVGAAQCARGFDLNFNAYEYWPKPEVLVVAAREVAPALQNFWQQLHRELAVHGLPGKSKALRPHVTIAWNVAQAPVLQAMSGFLWRARAFSLMRSDTGGTQSVYTVVDTWPLLDDTVKSSRN